MQGGHVLQGQITGDGPQTRIGALMCRLLGPPAATTQAAMQFELRSAEDAEKNKSEAGQLLKIRCGVRGRAACWTPTPWPPLKGE